MTDWFINWLIDQGGSGVSTGIVYIELREYMDMKWLMGSFGVFTGIMYCISNLESYLVSQLAGMYLLYLPRSGLTVGL